MVLTITLHSMYVCTYVYVHMYVYMCYVCVYVICAVHKYSISIYLAGYTHTR